MQIYEKVISELAPYTTRIPPVYHPYTTRIPPVYRPYTTCVYFLYNTCGSVSQETLAGEKGLEPPSNNFDKSNQDKSH